MPRPIDLTVSLAFVALLTTFASLANPPNGPLFQFTETRGPNAVGFKVIEQYDSSRSFRHSSADTDKLERGDRGRPLQTFVWYPARAAVSPVFMTVGDYVALTATETNFDRPKMSAEAKDWRDAMAPTLGMVGGAIRNAPPEQGRFPVVIYAPGFSGMAWENSDLCEYLASFGYVVLSSASIGASTRHMTGDVSGLNAQARDISFLIGYATTLSDAKTSQVAVIGHSWGGLSNLFAAARDDRITALIGLDGSLRYFPGLVAEAGDVHPEKMTIPMLYFAAWDWPLEDQDRLPEATSKGRSVLNAWAHGDLVTAHMLQLSHFEFGSASQRNEDRWWLMFHAYPWLQADYGRDDSIVGYAWMARYTLQFLNAYLKHDAVSITFLTNSPAQNGVPQHVMAINFHSAVSLPSFESFRAEVGRQGFEHAGEIYAAFQKQTPDFKLDEGVLGDWADELVTDGHLTEAMVLFKLNVQMHPDSSGTYISLGDGYVLSGQKQLAIEQYRKALQKDPLNGFAQLKLHKLTGQ